MVGRDAESLLAACRQHVARCNDLALPGGFTPFLISGRTVGWLGPEVVRALTFRPDSFTVDARVVALAERLRARATGTARGYDCRSRPFRPDHADTATKCRAGCSWSGFHTGGNRLAEPPGRPEAGPVFLSRRGAAYRTGEGRGGNPLARAHAMACARAGIAGFQVHDWRHHWASWQVLNGTDLSTLMKIGGWRTLRMVQRYAAVLAEHVARAARRNAS